ncbi:glycosyltransferase [Arthrobacter sp. MYb213]|uniref:glycosyltransferase n=1 Tax=Arthrobacter sp. MYb213 TaxID=1848595 RepID=UPI000CFAD34C|nr:glycosyltransferase [Arthrobacter sp. MYb213]PRB72650.1 glycosyl transferase [Arthrobacter sp. MYb213]
MASQLMDSPNPLRIAVLAHLHHPIRSPYAGGMEAHTAHLVSHLGSRGHEVILFAKEGSEQLSPQSRVRIHPVLAHSFVVNGYPDEDQRNDQHLLLDAAMDKAVQTIRTGEFDVVINNSLSPIPHAQLRGIPVLHILHTPPLPRIVAQLKTEKTDPLHRYATVSESNAALWRPWLEQLQVVSNGINLDFWATQNTCHVELGTAAWSGRITPEKGTHLAIEAARANGLRLFIAGPIQDQEYFDNLIAPKLGERTVYAGHLDQGGLRELIGASEVFISSPLWEEPFGLTTLEAMACCTPVAATPAGAMAELLGTTGGAIASESTAEALGVAVGHARSMDRAAVLARASRFTHELMIQTYESMMNEILDEAFSTRAQR